MSNIIYVPGPKYLIFDIRSIFITLLKLVHQDPMFTNVTCKSVYQGRTKNLDSKIICLFRKCAENPQLSESLCFKGKIFGTSILL